VLSFSRAEGLRLKCEGSITGAPLPIGIGTLERVLGVVESRRAVTLQDCFVTRASLGSAPREEFRANHCVLGAHTETLDEQRYTKFQMDVDRLAEWSDANGLREQITVHDNRLTEIKGEYTFPPDCSFAVDDATVGLLHRGMVTRERATRLTVDWSTSWFVDPQEPITLPAFLSRFGQPLHQLVALALRRSVSITAISALPTPAGGNRPENIDRVNFIYQPADTAPDHLEGHQPLLFRLRDIPEPSNGLTSWLRAWQDIPTVLQLIGWAQSGRDFLADQRFAMLVQALESYHRDRVGGRVMDEGEHRSLVAAATTAIPSSRRAWLAEKLRYSNELSLRQRLRDLITRQSAVMGPIIDDPRRFVELTVATRNYFTHHDSTLKARAARGRTLLWLTKALRHLSVSLALGELGIGPEEAAALLTNDDEYRYLQQEKTTRPWE
jgi:hypothetical protein